MHYWDDMQDKWGFSDGDAVPPDADARRAVYIQGVNHLAEELGSAYRVQAFDRGGLHNWCMIVRVPKDADPQDLSVPEGQDDALLRAIELASDMGLDDYIRVHVEIDRAGLEDFLTNLEIEDEDDDS